jgi:hypothetical protein
VDTAIIYEVVGVVANVVTLVDNKKKGRMVSLPLVHPLKKLVTPMISDGIAKDNAVLEQNAEYGYPVHKHFVAKSLMGRNPAWTQLDEWEILSESEALERHLKGADVIWSLVSRERFGESLKQYQSGQYKNSKKRPTDKAGRRTIDDSLIEWCDTVLFDFDECPFSEVPEAIKNGAWLMCPSASQTGPNVNGDVDKMHFVFKMPYRIKAEYARAYREIFLERMSNGKKYDKACTDPRREFYGMNPHFSDKRFIKVALENRIDARTHGEILIEATKRAEVKPEKKNSEENSLLGKLDAHLLEHCDLETIATTLFDECEWSRKGESPKCHDQYETTFPINSAAENPTAFAIEHSKLSERIYGHYKGGDQPTYSLYELYARYKRYLKGEEDADTKDVSKDLKGGNFGKLIKEICKKLEIPELKTEKPKKDKEKPPKGTQADFDQILEGIDDNHVLFVARRADKAYFYVVYTHTTNVWDYSGDTQAFKSVFEDLLERMNAELVERDLAPIETIHELAMIMADNHRTTGRLLHDIPNPRSNWIGFKDCDYNRTTGEFEEFHPDHNVWRRWEFAIKDVKVDPGIKQRYLDAFRFMTKNDDAAQMMWLYKCAEYIGLGTDIYRGLIISGESRTGKSAYCQSATTLKIFTVPPRMRANKNVAGSDIHVSFTKKELEGSHAMQKVNELTTCVHFPEYSIKTQDDVDFILQFCDHDKDWTINPKHKAPYTIKRDFILYMSIQDNVVMPNSNDGIDNRLLMIKNVLPNKAGLSVNQGGMVYKDRSWEKELNDLFFTPEIQREMFVYILQNESPDKVVADIKALYSAPYFLESLDSVKSHNTILTTYFEESSYEITGNPNDYVRANELKADVKRFMQSEGHKGSTNSVNHALLAHFKVKHPESWKLIEPTLAKNEMVDRFKWIEGKTVRVVPGIRLVTSEMIRNGQQETVSADF